MAANAQPPNAPAQAANAQPPNAPARAANANPPNSQPPRLNAENKEIPGTSHTPNAPESSKNIDKATTGKAEAPSRSGKGRKGAGGSVAAAASPQEKLEKRLGLQECQTCRNRKYQDSSDDPGVSFQQPTAVAPQAAASAVNAHESEHVRNESDRAQREGRRIVMQSVRIHTDICPECGKVYVAGGTTTTITAADNRENAREGRQEGLGGLIDARA
jgi:hypothetical protein